MTAHSSQSEMPNKKRNILNISMENKTKKQPLVLWLLVSSLWVAEHVKELAQSLLSQTCRWESYKQHPDTLPESRWAYLTHLLPHPDEIARDSRQHRTVYVLQRKAGLLWAPHLCWNQVGGRRRCDPVCHKAGVLLGAVLHVKLFSFKVSTFILVHSIFRKINAFE